MDLILPREIGERIDTSPLLSSDAYAIRVSRSTHKGEDEGVILRAVKLGSLPTKIYLPSKSALLASKLLSESQLGANSLVLGDDDIIFSAKELEDLFPLIKRIYAVNLVDSSNRVTAIPLGLESPSYRSAGRLKDFTRKISYQTKDRRYSFLAVWNNETFPDSRIEALNNFSNTKDTYARSKRIAPQTFHNLARRSLFVVCPRGNGLDTHRVWEALYLGSIPIIKKSEYFAALKGWPVWTVDTWDEPCRYSRIELEQRYRSFGLSRERLIALSSSVMREIDSE
jgi:hypothetical protein